MYTRAEQLIDLINNHDYWEMIDAMTIIVMSIIDMVIRKVIRNYIMQVALMPNVTSKLSWTKVYRCVTYLATKDSIKSSIKFAFNCVYTVIFWFDQNCDIIKNHNVSMKIIVMLKFKQSLRPSVHLKWKLKYTEKVRVVASQLLHCDWCVRQYYSECYNKDI